MIPEANKLKIEQQKYWRRRARGGADPAKVDSRGRSRKSCCEAVRRASRKKREKFNALKNGPCADCGGRFHPYVMDFDHRPGTEKHFAISLAANMNIAWDRVLAEVAKCDLICANCHRVRTWNQIEARRLATPPSPIDDSRCRRGHLRTDENTRIRIKGGKTVRECRICERTAARERLAERKSSDPSFAPRGPRKPD